MRLSGMNFNVNLGDIMVQVDTASLAITDNRPGMSRALISMMVRLLM